MMVMMESLLLTFDKFRLDRCQKKIFQVHNASVFYMLKEMTLTYVIKSSLTTLDIKYDCYCVLLMVLLLLLFITILRLCFNDHGKIVAYKTKMSHLVMLPLESLVNSRTSFT